MLTLLKVPKSLAEFPVGRITNRKIDVKIIGNLLICFDAVEEASVVATGQQHLLPQHIERIGNTLTISGSNLGAYLCRGSIG